MSASHDCPAWTAHRHVGFKRGVGEAIIADKPEEGCIRSLMPRQVFRVDRIVTPWSKSRGHDFDLVSSPIPEVQGLVVAHSRLGDIIGDDGDVQVGAWLAIKLGSVAHADLIPSGGAGSIRADSPRLAEVVVLAVCRDASSVIVNDVAGGWRLRYLWEAHGYHAIHCELLDHAKTSSDGIRSKAAVPRIVAFKVLVLRGAFCFRVLA